MEELYVVHYAEIGLKGGNRSVFEKQLIENVVRQHDIAKSWRLPGRIILRSGPELDLSKVFGVAWWAKTKRVKATVEEIGIQAIDEARRGVKKGQKFAVRAKVADKSFALNSQEVEVEIGQRIRDATELEVDLTAPHMTVFIEVTQTGALIYTEKRPGPGGLPVGTSAKLLGLFSGGMDSALATYLMAKRGSGIELVHFHAMPNADAAHSAKIGEMARKMTHYDADLCVHYVPYHRFQIAASGLPKKLQRYELVAFRRFMARVAERIAMTRRIVALFSGDNLGQVASQTLENLIAVDSAISMPIFRPVIAYDKVEIVDLTKRIGLYEISIEAYKDCCSIIAKHPATRANIRMIEMLEVEIRAEELLEDVLAEVETIELDQV
jgi:thiamine biosynthesis protein ThiI